MVHRPPLFFFVFTLLTLLFNSNSVCLCSLLLDWLGEWPKCGTAYFQDLGKQFGSPEPRCCSEICDLQHRQRVSFLCPSEKWMWSCEGGVKRRMPCSWSFKMERGGRGGGEGGLRTYCNIDRNHFFNLAHPPSLPLSHATAHIRF